MKINNSARCHLFPINNRSLIIIEYFDKITWVFYIKINIFYSLHISLHFIVPLFSWAFVPWIYIAFISLSTFIHPCQFFLKWAAVFTEVWHKYIQKGAQIILCSSMNFYKVNTSVTITQIVRYRLQQSQLFICSG